MNDRAPIRDRSLVLRILVPGLEARLRDKMKEMEDRGAAATNKSTPTNSNTTATTKNNNNNNNKDIYLDLEGVTCEPTAARGGTLWSFHCDGATYPARLVNLPCPVELHKTHDHAAYYKSADIAQMLIVYEDDMALEEAEEKPVDGSPSYFHSGLTPPLRRVVERRFCVREHASVVPPRSAVVDVELELMELMEKLGKDDKAKRNKGIPTLTSATKVLEEVEEEIVDYEPWMSENGRQPQGIEFDADDPVCSSHPEVWLRATAIQEIRYAADEEKRKREAATQKKEAKRKDKLKDKPIKKGIASRKKEEVVDDVTHAATAVLAGDGFDLMALDDDDLFGDINLDNDEILQNF